MFTSVAGHGVKGEVDWVLLEVLSEQSDRTY
jgi:hypothetical protein